MNPFSSMVLGFRLVFRRPAIPLGEIAWRWSFVAATWVLGALFAVEYIDTLPVSVLDRLLLGTRQPILVARALHRIFHGSALHFTEGAILLTAALAIAWILLASFGRAATLSSLLDDLGVRRSSSGGAFFPGLIGLNFLRLAATLSAVLGTIGAALIANSAWASSHVRATDASRVFFLGLFLIWLVWCVLNWFLSTAAIPAVANRAGALAAIEATLDICLKKSGPVLTTGVFFLLLHIATLFAAAGIAFVALGMVGALGMGATFLLEAAIAMVYCALADFLYTGRMAAYVSIIEDVPGLQLEPAAAPSLAHDNFSRIDQNELILSDVPTPST